MTLNRIATHRLKRLPKIPCVDAHRAAIKVPGADSGCQKFRDLFIGGYLESQKKPHGGLRTPVFLYPQPITYSVNFSPLSPDSQPWLPKALSGLMRQYKMEEEVPQCRRPTSTRDGDPLREPRARSVKDKMHTNLDHDFCQPLMTRVRGHFYMRLLQLCLLSLSLAQLPPTSAKLGASCKGNDCLQAVRFELCLRPNDAPNIPVICACPELEPLAHEHRLNVLGATSHPVQYYNKTTGESLGNSNFSMPSGDSHIDSDPVVVCAIGPRRDARDVTRCWIAYGDSDFNNDHDGCDCAILHKPESQMPARPCWENFGGPRSISETIMEATTQLLRTSWATLNTGLGAMWVW